VFRVPVFRVFTFVAACFCFVLVREALVLSDPFRHQKLHCRNQVPSVAAVVFEGAIYNVLGRKLNINFSSSLGAQPVSEHSSCYEGPASTAVLLVKNLWLAHWKFFPKVKVQWHWRVTFDFNLLGLVV
jgi:hypothetical protein